MPASGFAAMALPHAQIGSAKGMPLLAHPRGPGPPGREKSPQKARSASGISRNISRNVFVITYTI